MRISSKVFATLLFTWFLACGDFVSDPDHAQIVTPRLSSSSDCLSEPAGVFRPECRPSWSGYGTDNTQAIHDAIWLAKHHVDVTNCDIRNTSNRSPYNTAEPWCAGVVFRAGLVYRLPRPTSDSATIVTTMGDWSVPALTDYSGDGYDQVFGITLEGDDPSGARPAIDIGSGGLFVIGSYDRLRHMHIRGPFYNTPIPWCTGKEGNAALTRTAASMERVTKCKVSRRDGRSTIA